MTPTNPSEEARVIRLCRERAEGYGALRRSSTTAIALDMAADLIERLAKPSPDTVSGEVDVWREALKPFAEAADNLDAKRPDKYDLWEQPESMMLTAGDLRRARRLYASPDDCVGWVEGAIEVGR